MLNISNLTFSYKDKPVLENISFTLNKGQHLALIGESGSGKSTLLKSIYGLLELNSGSVHWNNTQVLGPNFNLIPGERYMKYVSQDFDLMPFTSVYENVAEHLSVFEMDGHKARVAELLKTVDMEPDSSTKVKNLSGGQKQRVAIARALALEPEILLLDEPFSNIDQYKKNKLRFTLFPYLKEKNITIITATHDPEDVLAFADEVLVLQQGKKKAHGPTRHVYEQPGESYIASLFGLVNKVPIKLFKEYAETDANVLVYPHEFEISNENGLEIFVTSSHFKGAYYLIEGISESGHRIFFTNRYTLKTHVKVFLNLPLSLVNKRMVFHKDG